MNNIFGLVGCGYWGKNHLETLQKIDNITLKYVCDVQKPPVKIPKETKFTSDYNELLTDAETNCIIIATPTKTHYSVAKKFLEAGKNVLVEKPLTTNTKEAEELINIAKKENVQLMVGEIFRYNQAIKYIKTIIKNGEIGNLRYIESKRVGLGPIRNDVSVLWDLATHDIYMSNLLVGKLPKLVNYQGISHNNHLDDICSLNLKYKNPDVLTTIYVNWEHPIKERKLIVGGTKKAVLFNDINPLEKVEVYNRGVSYQPSTGNFGDFQSSLIDGDIIIPKIKSSQPLQDELKHFINCVNGNEKCISDGSTGLETIKVLEAAEKSRLNKGIEVEVT